MSAQHHQMSTGQPAALDDALLKQFTELLFEKASPELFDSVWEQAGLTPPLISRITTLQTALPLVRAGLGISIMPQGVEHLRMEDIVVRSSVEPIPPLQAVAISSKERPAPTAAKMFLEWLEGYNVLH